MGVVSGWTIVYFCACKVGDAFPELWEIKTVLSSSLKASSSMKPLPVSLVLATNLPLPRPPRNP